MIQLKRYFTESLRAIKKIQTMTGSAMLVAMSVVADFFTVVITPTLHLGIAFLPVAVSGMLYGPFIGGIVGVVADIVKYIIRPKGPFFLGFTFNEFLIGFLFGLFLYKKPITLKRVFISKLTITIVINLIFTPIWLNIMYGNEIFAVSRLIKAIATFPFEVALLYFICKTITKLNINRTEGHID